MRLRLICGTPQSEDTPERAPQWPLRPGSFFLSVLFHAAIAIALIFVPPVVEAEKPVDVVVYERLQLRQAPIIYWPEPSLPAISPETPIGGSSQFRGEELSRKQAIVVERPTTDPAKQLIWQPDKPERLQNETPLENMVAVKGKVAPKPFDPPPASLPATTAPQSLPVPEIQPAKPQELPSAVAGLTALPTAKPKPKAFVAPKQQPRLALQPGDVADAPPELAQAQGRSLAETGSALGSGTLPRKPAPFVPPSRSRGVGVDRGKDLSAPPEISAGGTGSAVTVAVIGLESGAKLTALPDGSRSASFSRAPTSGSPTGGSVGDNPVIPGVAIAGLARTGSSPLLPSPPPVSGGSRSVEIRIPASASTMSVPLRPASRVLPREIESRFSGRVVYTLLIQKPNFPEYAADWTIWFAERTASAAATSTMRPPVPVRKTIREENQPPAATLSGTRVQISAIIGRDGKVSGIAPLLGRNPGVAARAAEDLANWEFRPAYRNGEPVAVEAVIEIPFRFQ